VDIWRWVLDTEDELERNGDGRLAYLMRMIPHFTCEDRHAEVDALMPEALALARARKSPWIELFLRHWHLQSRVLHRHEVRDALPEAVSLLEYASRDETRGCPQSVCCTQDLAACYGDLDGPGYAEERLAVSAETLSRIDPTWPCFDCISAEHASALADAGRADDRLVFLRKQAGQLGEAGRKPGSNLRRQTTEALLELGRHEEALEHAKQLVRAEHGQHGENDGRSIHARALALCGQAEEGARVLPDAQAILDSPALGARWIRAVRALVDASAYPNDWELGRVLRRLHDRLRDNGALYESAWVATHAAELAIQRGARSIAELALTDAEAMLPKLRKPEALAPRVREARAACEALPPVTLLTVDAAWDALDAGSDPERVLDGVAGLPPSDEVERLRAHALDRAGASEAAIALLSAYLERTPDATGVAFMLADLWAARRQLDRMAEALRAAREREAPYAAYFGWRYAEALREGGRLDEARTVLGEVTSGPAPLGAFALMARMEREAGELEKALARLDRMVENDVPVGEIDWERMICATLLGRWASVRHSAARVGMNVGEGDAPIDAPGPFCGLRTELGGKRRIVYAVRNGPVTARIVDLTGMDGAVEHFDSVVVFDPRPDNPNAQPSEDGRAPVFIYPWLEVLTPGGFRSWRVEGLHPGHERVRAAQQALLHDAGLELQVLSGSSYVRQVDGEPKPAVYALIGAHETMEPAAVSAAVRRALEGTTLVWPELSRDAGDPDLEAQCALGAELGLPPLDAT
jgi:tetratricopeptide (TPR) repeat protein